MLSSPSAAAAVATAGGKLLVYIWLLLRYIAQLSSMAVHKLRSRIEDAEISSF